MKSSKTVDEFILRQEKWQSMLIELRAIAKASGLDEFVKWGVPVYAYKGKNIMGLAPFKDYVAIWFYQGALLKDTLKKLINAQEGVTKALMQWRFCSIDEIEHDLIAEYIKEAVDNEKSGIKISPTSKPKLEIPFELNSIFNKNKAIKNNFEKLTPYKQREYIEFVSSAKRQETRDKRLEKIIPLLLAGFGLNDNYR